MLAALERPATEEEVAGVTGLPLFRVRSGLRELVAAGLVSQQGGRFVATGPQSL
jgi:DNA-binding IclR family transcriptional regulator